MRDTVSCLWHQPLLPFHREWLEYLASTPHLPLTQRYMADPGELTYQLEALSEHPPDYLLYGPDGSWLPEQIEYLIRMYTHLNPNVGIVLLADKAIVPEDVAHALTQECCVVVRRAPCRALLPRLFAAVEACRTVQ